jgi:hypothetical protein
MSFAACPVSQFQCRSNAYSRNVVLTIFFPGILFAILVMDLPQIGFDVGTRGPVLPNKVMPR